jgi:hypothetical protein
MGYAPRPWRQEPTMSTCTETPVSSLPWFNDELSLGRIRAALVQHRRRLDESERTFRQWQARWWLRERVIEQQIRRVQLQLSSLPVTLAPVRPPIPRNRVPRTRLVPAAVTSGLGVVCPESPA